MCLLAEFETNGEVGLMADNWQWHDLHVHTRPHSPDAHRRATVSAMLRQAADNGVWTVGLANHYFPTTNPRIFRKLRQQVEKETPDGMTVLVGAELCVLDSNGTIHLTENEAQQFDFILAGPHHFGQRWVEKPSTGSADAFIQHQHQMLLGAARNPLVDGMAHPWVINIQHAQRRWGFAPDEFSAVWSEDYFWELGQVAKTYDTAIEIGMGIHLMAEHQGEHFWEMYVRGMRVAREAGAKFYFGSDAHHLHVIARLDWLRPTLAKLGFTPADIILPDEWKNGFGNLA